MLMSRMPLTAKYYVEVLTWLVTLFAVVLLHLSDIHVTEPDPFVRKRGVELLVDLALVTENDMQYEQLMHVLQKVASFQGPHQFPQTLDRAQVRCVEMRNSH